jgi:hypothetical protein
VAETLDVRVYARHHLGGLVRMAREQPRAGDDAAPDLLQPEHPPRLARLAGLAFAQDRRGSNRLTTFSGAGTVSPCRTRRVVCSITCATRGTIVAGWSPQRCAVAFAALVSAWAVCCACATTLWLTTSSS